MIVVEGAVTVDDLDTVLSELNAVAAAHDVTVQAFDARYVVDRRHLERAVELADRAFDRGENVARERSVEILLYAAGRRQIDDALEMGVSEGRLPVAVVVAATGDAPDRETAAADALRERLDLDIDPTATLDSTDDDRVRDFFDVTSAELDAVDGDLSDLIAERVALLDVKK
ncbi:KEOPS complex subunit Cgi121 [Haloplanus sp.]|uniref:KEOPS complex subunit Cgi121 n=1 Tax=Haloplanus sp. TaxID=1961696 RepID=UPI00262B2F44|nr:KEOPS complex subunit Cgi121 [Haloplanus sp.]